MTNDPNAAGCPTPCIACMTDESHAPNPPQLNPCRRTDRHDSHQHEVGVTTFLCPGATAPSVPADTDLRDRITQAIDTVTGGTCPGDIIDAVLAALPEHAEAERLRAERDEAREQCTEMEQQHRFAQDEAQGRRRTDRAAALREAADEAETFDIDASPQAVAAALRRMADEAQQAGEGR